MYVYGGFELDSPNIPTEKIQRINLSTVLATNPKILGKVETILKSNRQGPQSQKSLEINNLKDQSYYDQQRNPQ